MKIGRWLSRGVLVCTALLLGMSVAQAADADYPTRPVTLLVPFAPGGPVDALARILAPALQEKWRQPVIVENRGGAGGAIGSALAARAKADGHTLLLTGTGSLMPVTIFTKDPGFDPAKDFKAVTTLAGYSFVFVVNPNVPASNIGEFISYAKQRPKFVNHGIIPLTQFEFEFPIFENKVGIDMTAIPFTSPAQLLIALLNNDVQVFFAAPFQVAQQVATGKLKALAIMGQRRVDELPGVPTLRESGILHDAGADLGLFVPTGTPDSLVEKIASDIRTALRTPDTEAKVKKLGLEVIADSPAQSRDAWNRTSRAYTDIARELGIKPQ